MNHEKEENEKAFACVSGTPQDGWLQEGMDLRDWFAGMALQGLLAKVDNVKPIDGVPIPQHKPLRQFEIDNCVRRIDFNTYHRRRGMVNRLAVPGHCWKVR